MKHLRALIIRVRKLGKSHWRPVVGLGCVLLALIGLTATIAGGHDLIFARRIEERLIGGVLLCTGSTTCVGLLVRTRRHRRWSVICFGVGSIPGIIVAAVQVSFQVNLWLIAWVAAAVVPLIAMTVLLSHGVRPFGGSKAEIGTLLTAAITVLVAAVGLGSTSRPVDDAGTVDVSVEVSQVGQRTDAKGGRFALVKSRVTFENKSRRRLTFMASSYSLVGYKGASRRNPASTTWTVGAEMDAKREGVEVAAGWSGRYEPYEVYDGVEFGIDDLSPGARIDAGEEVVLEFISVVDLADTDTVSSCYGVTTARADRMILGDRLTETMIGEAVAGHLTHESADAVGTAGEWLIEPTSWLGWITRGNRTVHIAYRPRYVDKRMIDLLTEYDIYGYAAGKVNYADLKPRANTFYGILDNSECGVIVLDRTTPAEPAHR
jgi:hypothetical protein